MCFSPKFAPLTLFQYKLTRVERLETLPGAVPVLHTNDGRTIRYPDPDVRQHDTIKV